MFTNAFTNAEENFNNQVDRMAHSVDSRQHLSPATSVFIQWSHEPSGNGDSDRDYARTQQHGPGPPQTKVDPAVQTVLLIAQNSLWE